MKIKFNISDCRQLASDLSHKPDSDFAIKVNEDTGERFVDPDLFKQRFLYWWPAFFEMLTVARGFMDSNAIQTSDLLLVYMDKEMEDYKEPKDPLIEKLGALISALNKEHTDKTKK